MRAFIFSLDAFVAFTLALLAIYSLIFFSSVPSSYYYLLTQCHYLTRDVLMSLSTTACDDAIYACTNTEATLLENIASETDANLTENMIQNTVGLMVPPQFGYIVEKSENEGNSWDLLYDTRDHVDDPHAKTRNKLTVSAQVIAFDYAGDVKKLKVSPYNYLTCGNLAYGSDAEAAAAGYTDWGLITCGIEVIDVVTGDTVPTGNVHPSQVLGDDLVPSSDVAIVRLTVFI
jgi:hypothetical protein